MGLSEIWKGLLDGRAGSTLLVVLAAILLALASRAFARRIAEPTSRRFVIKTMDYVTVLLAMGAVAKIWIQAFNLGTLFGLSAAGLVLALKEPVASFAGWLFILARHPLRVGDRIQIGTGLSGDVVDIRLFMFSLLEIGHWIDGDQHTGRVVHVPNSVVFTSSIANYTSPLPWIWHEHHVHVTYDSDWEAARAQLLAVLRRHADAGIDGSTAKVEGRKKRDGQLPWDTEPNVWVSITPYCIRLSLRYLCDARRRRGSEMEMSTHVLRALQATPNVTLAYPTQRVWLGAPGEGAGAGPAYDLPNGSNP